MSPQPKRGAAREAAQIREDGAPDDAAVEAGLPTAAESREAGEQSGQRAPRHTAQRLISEPTILGQPAAVVAGAFHDAEIGDEDELTEAEAERYIAAFLERPVQNDVEV